MTFLVNHTPVRTLRGLYKIGFCQVPHLRKDHSILIIHEHYYKTAFNDIGMWKDLSNLNVNVMRIRIYHFVFTKMQVTTHNRKKQPQRVNLMCSQPLNVMGIALQLLSIQTSQKFRQETKDLALSIYKAPLRGYQNTQQAKVPRMKVQS